VITFALLSASFALVLLAPDWRAGGLAVHQWLRFGGWGAAAVSISWAAARRLGRRAARD